MNDRDIVFLAILVIALILLVRRDSMMWRLSKINGKSYYVKNLKDAGEAADHLAKLDTLVTTFLDAAQKLDPKDERLQRIREKWSGTLSETPPHADNVAYSLGKNSIYICVREKSGALADINTSMFVLLHELAHVATVSIGHTKEFWRNMQYLLELAEETGVYTYVDHDESDESLCGRVLGTNPLSCVKDKTCESEKKKSS